MPPDAYANQPADLAMVGPPAPIVASRTTWHLGASPADLEGVAGILSGIGMAGEGTRDKVDSAAFTVFAEGAWEGEAAEAYLQHRGG